MTQTTLSPAATESTAAPNVPDNVASLLNGVRHLVEEARAASGVAATDDQRQLAGARLAAVAPLLDALAAAWSTHVQTSERCDRGAAPSLEAAAEVFGAIAGKARQVENLIGHAVSSGDLGLVDAAEAVVQVIGATADAAAAACGGVPVVSHDAGAWVHSKPMRLHLEALSAHRAALPM